MNPVELQPQIEFLPARTTVPRGAESTLDVLIRISAPPAPVTDEPRLPLNLGIVLDRSGSMAAENKLGYAKQAAEHLVRALADEDTVALVIFDDEVKTASPSAWVGADRRALQGRIAAIVDGGSTDLHGGWLEGGTQVAGAMREGALNRVLLLSDGMANVGEVNPAVICDHVRGLTRRGVSTTTLGLGMEYNEDLLQAMAEAGDGNYYFIESPSQIPRMFEAELAGLSTTHGTKVSLEITGRGDVEVLDVLNDFKLTDSRRHMLPNLVQGQPVEAIARLRLPAVDHDEMRVCRVRLAWDDRKSGLRSCIVVKFAVPTATEAGVAALPENPVVREQAILLAVARDKRKAADEISRGHYGAAEKLFGHCMSVCESMPVTAKTKEQIEELKRLRKMTHDGDYVRTSKLSKSSSYRYTSGRPKL